jgi:hypothetical protein
MRGGPREGGCSDGDSESLNRKTVLEWCERLPLDFGRKPAHARERSGIA